MKNKNWDLWWNFPYKKQNNPFTRFPEEPHEKIPKLSLENASGKLIVPDTDSSKNVDIEFINALPVARKSLPPIEY